MGIPAPSFPYPITLACTSLPHLESFADLPDGFIRIVSRIIQKINLKNPFTEIFATRSTIANESGKSLDTVHRAVKWLEDHGMIERERKAKIGYRGSKSPLIPTQKFLHSLNLVDENGNSREFPKFSTKTDFSDANKKSAPGANAAPTEKKNRLFKRFGNVSLPIDLSWLCERGGLTPYGVLGLMKLARSVKQTLSEVVHASMKYLDGLTKNELYAYITKLLQSGRDFKNLSEISKENDKNREISEYLKEKQKIFFGKKFISQSTRTIYEFTEDSVKCHYPDGASKTMVLEMGLLEAIQQGKLRPYVSQPKSCGPNAASVSTKDSILRKTFLESLFNIKPKVPLAS